MCTTYNSTSVYSGQCKPVQLLARTLWVLIWLRPQLQNDPRKLLRPRVHRLPRHALSLARRPRQLLLGRLLPRLLRRGLLRRLRRRLRAVAERHRQWRCGRRDRRVELCEALERALEPRRGLRQRRPPAAPLLRRLLQLSPSILVLRAEGYVGGTHRDEVLERPPLGVGLHALALCEAREVRDDAAGERAVAVPALEHTDEPPARHTVCERARVLCEAVVE